MPPENSDDRRAAIHAAAITEFVARGFAGTSMAHIAATAGMSRPALYLYFDNKADIFASAFAALIDETVDRALAALRSEGSTAEQLDGFLQRFDGDLWQSMSSSPHSQELLDAKYEHAAEATEQGLARLRKGVGTWLRATGASTARRTEWAEMLELSPKGFKYDNPTVPIYRRRLSALARSIAADIDATRP